MSSSNHNRVRLNTFSGNGSVPRTNPPGPGFVSNNFGLGLIGTSSNNLVEENKIGGNFNGIRLGAATKGGNIFRRNVIAGNPPVQISNEFGASVGVDIQDLSNPALGANTFEDNRCLTYVGQMTPAPCPNLGEHEEDAEQGRGSFCSESPRDASQSVQCGISSQQPVAAQICGLRCSRSNSRV